MCAQRGAIGTESDGLGSSAGNPFEDVEPTRIVHSKSNENASKNYPQYLLQKRHIACSSSPPGQLDYLLIVDDPCHSEAQMEILSPRPPVRPVTQPHGTDSRLFDY